jgi:outer membrane protein
MTVIQPRSCNFLDRQPEKRPHSMGLAFAAALFLAISSEVSQEARADDPAPTAPTPVRDPWSIAVGIGAVNMPRYPGSHADVNRVVPIVSASYGRYFIGALPDAGIPAGLGVNLIRNPHWLFGVGVGDVFRKPRLESDDPVLRGWGNIRATPRGALFGNYSLDWLSVRANVSTDIGGHHEGTVGSLAVMGKLHPIENLTLSAGPEATWGDAQYTKTFFGVDAAQGAIAGIPEYQTKAGINTVGLAVGADYRFTERWSASAHVSYGKLEGSAIHSPVTTSTDQRVFALFTFYHF